MLIKAIEIAGKEVNKLTLDFQYSKDLLNNDNLKEEQKRENLDTLIDLIRNIEPFYCARLEAQLNSIFDLEYSLYPVLKERMYRLEVLEIVREFFEKVDDGVLYVDDETVCNINRNNIHDAIKYYNYYYKQLDEIRNPIFEELEEKLNKISDKLEYIPIEIINYLSPYRISPVQKRFLNMFKYINKHSTMEQVCELLINREYDEEENFMIRTKDEIYNESDYFRHFDNEEYTLQEDVNFTVNFFSNLIKEDDHTKVVQSKSFTKIEDEIDEFVGTNNKMVREVRKAKNDKTKLAKARSSLKKNSGQMVKLVNRTMSLKNDDISKSLSLKHKILRIGISALVVGGAMAFPVTIIGKITTGLVLTVAADKYNTSRANRTLGVLEAQMDYLQEKMEETDDPEDRKDFNMAYKELKSAHKEISNGLKKYSNLKKGTAKVVTKGKAGNGSSGGNDYDY